MRPPQLALVTSILLGLAACQGGGSAGSTAGGPGGGQDASVSGGGGLGASLGQAAGGDSASALTGDVGHGIGHVIGDDADRAKARRMSEAARAADYGHDEVAPLGGTRWKVLDLQPRGRVPAFSSKIIDFRPNGRVITTTTTRHGAVDVADEAYRVVGKTVIINKPGLLVNGTFWFDGDRLIVDGKDFRVILLRVPA